MNYLKIAGAVASAAMSMALMTTTVFADDFSFDVTKAKETKGGGQSYTTFTRLTNEKRDKNNFDPTWMTDDSEFIIEYDASGEYDQSPVYLILQCWEGELVEASEDRWVSVLPSVCDASRAVFTREDISSQWGSELNDIYAINVGDTGKNSILVKSITVTNCNISSDAETITGGTVIVTGDAATVSADSEKEADTSADLQKEEGETVTVLGHTSSEKKADNKNTEQNTVDIGDWISANTSFVCAIAVAVVLFIILVVVLIHSYKKKHPWGSNWNNWK